jgi:hypothetical protein
MNAPLVDRQPSNRIERLEALGIVWKLKAQQRLRRRNAMGLSQVTLTSRSALPATMR